MTDEVDKTLVVIVGILAITSLEIAALIQGIDGTILSASIGAIGMIIGGALGFKFGKRQTSTDG